MSFSWWLTRPIRPHEWNPETRVGGTTAMGRQQVEMNRLRAEAYSSLVALLETVVE